LGEAVAPVLGLVLVVLVVTGKQAAHSMAMNIANRIIAYFFLFTIVPIYQKPN
jgi:hypothetical protein